MKYAPATLAALLGLMIGLFHWASLFKRFGHASQVQASATSPASDSRGATLHLTPQLRARSRLRFGQVEFRSQTECQLVPGTVSFDPDFRAELASPVPAVISKVFVKVGDRVERGQPLIELDARTLGENYAALLTARANLRASRAQRARTQTLHEQMLATDEALERAEAEVTRWRLRVETQERALSLLGLGNRARARFEAGLGRGVVLLRAPLAGQIVERRASVGQGADGGLALLRIAEPARVWIELHVPELQLSLVELGSQLELRREASSHWTAARVVWLGDVIDPKTRTLRVRVEQLEPDPGLRPGAFVQACLFGPQSAPGTAVLPVSSLTSSNGEAAVFVATSANELVLREVQVGARRGGLVEITGGLSGQEHVVIEGGSVLRSQLPH